MNVYFYWGAQQRHPPKIHHPFTQEPQKVHVKERFSLEFIRFLAVLLPLLLPSPRTTIYATQRNPPGPAHHLSMGSIAREDCGRERTIHSFPNKQNHNLFLVSKFPPFFALPDVPRVNVPLRHRFNGKIWPTLFVCSVFLRVVVTPRRSLPCYVSAHHFAHWHESFLCVFWLHLLTWWLYSTALLAHVLVLVCLAFSQTSGVHRRIDRWTQCAWLRSHCRSFLLFRNQLHSMDR